MKERASAIWAELHDLFDTDDGSLPEFRVCYSNVDATIVGYALLRTRAARVVSRDAHFWSAVHGEDRPVDSVPNAAALVVAGDAEPFHVVLGGIRGHASEIPDLGVFVFPDQLALDYRMGPAWGPAELEALFELLAELTRLDPAATLDLEEETRTEIRARFLRVWQRWQRERSR